MWIDRSSNLTNSTVYTITGCQLTIANVSALGVEEDKAIRCCEVLNNGIVVKGVEYKVEPLGMLLLYVEFVSPSLLLLMSIYMH